MFEKLIQMFHYCLEAKGFRDRLKNISNHFQENENAIKKINSKSKNLTDET